MKETGTEQLQSYCWSRIWDKQEPRLDLEAKWSLSFSKVVRVTASCSVLLWLTLEKGAGFLMGYGQTWLPLPKSVVSQIYWFLCMCSLQDLDFPISWNPYLWADRTRDQPVPKGAFGIHNSLPLCGHWSKSVHLLAGCITVSTIGVEKVMMLIENISADGP